MTFDYTALLALLTSPQILTLVAPLITEVIDKVVVVLPNSLKPLISIVVGAIAAALGGTTPAVAGAAAGLGGIGVAEILTHAKRIVSPKK